MDFLSITLAVLGIITASGAMTAYYKRGEGKETISLLKTNIDAYKDAEKLKNQRIIYLEGQLIVKDETIKRLLGDSKN